VNSIDAIVVMNLKLAKIILC